MTIRKIATPTQVAAAAALAIFQLSVANAQSSNDTLKLDEVVVTGTATGASKMKQSSSISTVASEQILQGQPTNASDILRSIPGTVGGFVRMNGGAYGGEVKDILRDCDVVMRDGTLVTLPVEDLHYSYRHSELPDGAIVVAARFQGHLGDPEAIQAEMDRISASREASQPLRSKTGGSTFKNPDGHKAWQLVDAAGCRGLQIGGAQVSEKHTNFLINADDATSADIEVLGEEVRARVMAHSGVDLIWEIQRVGETK